MNNKKCMYANHMKTKGKLLGLGQISGYPARKSRISGNIWQDMPEYPAISGIWLEKPDPAKPLF